MKALKLTIAALLLAFTFQAASAQIRVGVHIGTPPPPHRVIVAHRPVVVYHPVGHPTVIVRHGRYHRPYYNRHYYSRHYYNRPHRVVVVRRHY
ncbi:MAG TPA: hypothetical protein VIQ77_08900 [Mucilaginibacter sp.]